MDFLPANPAARELSARQARFRQAMEKDHPGWDTALIAGKMNQYYLTGTVQDGLLLLRRDGDTRFFVRRSPELAREESPLPHIEAMESYRDAAARTDPNLGKTYLETETVPLSMLERLRKHFVMESVGSLDKTLLALRAVKSPYELAWMERSGRAHDALLRETVPGLLREGMTETELVTALYGAMMAAGHQGLCRFSRFQTEMVVGQVGFGESSLAPTNFDGPGGSRGLCPAVPLAGNPLRRLRKGDLVFVDIAFGMNGYHSDKTQVYRFGEKPTAAMAAAHRMCMEVQALAAGALRPGAVPAEIYRSIMDGLTADEKVHFMGYGERTVKFLGHGVGLHVDEFPVLAEGFREPLAENMTLALEPKKGVPGAGMVGVEDTYAVTPAGGRCLTGGGREILVV